MNNFKAILFFGLLIFVGFNSYAAEYGYVDKETRIKLERMNKLQPEYPRQALRLGIEGEVVLQFDVDQYGAVLDPYVVESNPGGLFERASIKAVRKLVYNPPIHEDSAVNVTDVRLRVVFKLQ